jgi:hypothetical protein
MKAVIRAIWLWLRGLFDRAPKAYRVIRVEELPGKLDDYIVYAIGVEEPWLAALRCPCGCGDTIQLSLLPNDSPRWRLSVDREETASLEPSIWRSRGCMAHFFVRAGRIDWCSQHLPSP